MKRVLVLVCGLLLIGCACGKRTFAPVVSGFRCHVDIALEDSRFSGTLDRAQAPAASLYLEEPFELRGLEMVYDGANVTMHYAGMSLEVDQSTMPVGAVIKTVCDTLDVCVLSDAAMSSSTFEGESPAGVYVVRFDENGMPLELSVPALALGVTFSEWETPQ